MAELEDVSPSGYAAGVRPSTHRGLPTTRLGGDVDDSAWGIVGYRARGQWSPLPEWARVLARLGAMLMSGPPDSVLGVSLPTRAFAAVLLGAGAVAESLSQGSQTIDPSEHFAYLTALPVGTCLVWTKDGFVRTAIHDGQGESPLDGRTYLRMQVQDPKRGGLVESCFPERSLGVQVAPQEHALPIGIVRGKSLNLNLRFVAEMVQGKDIETELAHTRPDVMLVGRKAHLEREAREEQLQCPLPQGSTTKGTLADLLRPSSLVGTSKPFRSHIVPYVSVTDQSSEMRPRVVVFDGAAAFLATRHHWHQSAWAVLLDRSDTHAPEAAAELVQLFLDRDEDLPLSSCEHLPLIEVLGFRVARR